MSVDLHPRWRPLLGPALWSDLAVAMLGGTQFIDHGDHLELRTPSNPGYLWGNCLQVLDVAATDDADRWVARHDELFPSGSPHLGLPGAPTPGVYEARQMEVVHVQALVADAAPSAAPVPAPYDVRPLVSDEDWERCLELFLAENAREAQHPSGPHREFLRARDVRRRQLVEQGLAQFFGVFHAEVLVAHSGIVRCGDVGRFQSVLVDADYRRRGLAAAVVRRAWRWAHDAGATAFVIVADADSPAERLYRGLGFTPSERMSCTYRRSV